MNRNRLFDSLDRLAAFTDTPDNGVTRFSWSDSDRKARMFLAHELREIGLSPYEDGIGNLRAVMKGAKPGPRIIIGSHLDSVRNAGRLDGAFGVVAAFEVLRSLHEEGKKPLRDIEFIAFAEEEGSNFGSTCLGSKAITGQVAVGELKEMRNAEGRSAYDMLRAFGLNPDALPDEQIDPASVEMFLEVHIEQGGRLEAAGKRLGVVAAISGMRLTEFHFQGHSNHAASPMQGRRDPMAAFAEVAFRLEEFWKKGVFPPNFSCTVGRVACRPNVGIVVPEEVDFTIDLRHVDVPTLEKGQRDVEAMVAKVAQERGIAMKMRPLSASGGVRMHPKAMDELRNAALRQGAEPATLISGPAHDAAPMGRIVPTGLLFVPSVKGLSHCPQENTLPDDLELGAAVLEDAVRSAACGEIG